MDDTLPIAVIGAGPVGLAAAAHLLERGLEPVILERADRAGAAVRAWGHVRLFSPWRYNIDAAAGRLLAASGWQPPEPEALPTGVELADRYLAPLAALPAMAPHLLLSTAVTAISREGLDKASSRDRAAAPFVLQLCQGDALHEIRAGAVIDASGTWSTPNPIGANGLPVEGEAGLADRIDYGLPDVSGARSGDFAGRRVLVAGGGHSAINVVLDLISLQQQAPETTIFWALRRDTIARLLGGGLNDQLPARGALGLAARAAIAAGRLTLLSPLAVRRLIRRHDHVMVEALLGGAPHRLEVDRIVVATGMRPDLTFLRELRLALDPVVEAPQALAPLIDPNLHSCGTVPPHGVAELGHPEAGFYIAGSKSYGRAPTFLMATGYEQVRSIAAELAGDREAARRVELVLPETGVCSADPLDGALEPASCGPAVASTGGCCVPDAAPRIAGGAGCCSAPGDSAADARPADIAVPAE